MSDDISGEDGPFGVDGTPGWAYSEDGYCVCCGNGHWKYHMPECSLAHALDLVKVIEALDTKDAADSAAYTTAVEGVAWSRGWNDCLNQIQSDCPRLPD